MKTIDVVTVTYGERSALLNRVLGSLMRLPDVRKVHVVDNGSGYTYGKSTDADNVDKVDIIRLGSNTGSANGFKAGIEKAIAKGAEYIWLLDDDNCPRSDALPLLIKQFKRLSASNACYDIAVTSMRPNHSIDRVSQQRGSGSSFLGFCYADIPAKILNRFIKKPAVKVADCGQTVAVFSCPYGGFFFHASLIEKIGLPNADFILYADDIEFSSRLSISGGKIVLITDSIVDDLEFSWNANMSNESYLRTWLTGGSDLRAFYSARNQVYTEHLRAKGNWTYWVNRCIYTVLLTTYALALRRLGRLRVLLSAIRDGSNATLGENKKFPL
ncbi:MAG: glycosyltransferase [Pseudomonadales bacterium]|nr:glycosyltransferase [Pseudomonadales bacterium]